MRVTIWCSIFGSIVLATYAAILFGGGHKPDEALRCDPAQTVIKRATPGGAGVLQVQGKSWALALFLG